MRNIGTKLCWLTIIFPTLSIAAEMPPTLELESISPHVANKIALAAFDDCTNRGYKVAAAVVGRDGNLLALVRNPLSGPHTVEVSTKKAYSAASLQRSTAEMKNDADLRFAPGILLIPGGVPISVAGKFYGGVAVAGADTDTDEKCSLSGIKAVSDTLEFRQ